MSKLSLHKNEYDSELTVTRSALCCSYHQKVPPVAPDLELKATYGLAAPEEFNLPAPNEQWTAAIYKAFDITKMPSRNEVCFDVADLWSLLSNYS